MILTIPKSANGGRIVIEVPGYAEASALYAKVRDDRNEGASTFASGTITEDGIATARISYNAKVWKAADAFKPDAAPLYNPYEA